MYKSAKFVNESGGILLTPIDEENGRPYYTHKGEWHRRALANEFGPVAPYEPRTPKEPTYEEVAAQVRAERNRLLRQTDWSQLPDVPQKLQKPLRMYRRALRHITQQKGFPFDVSWPQYPL